MMKKYDIRPVRVKKHGSQDCGGPELEQDRALKAKVVRRCHLSE
jgi:hypothetical protein